jgi:hypothetical protein
MPGGHGPMKKGAPAPEGVEGLEAVPFGTPEPKPKRG